jgi:hypothetical protein
MKHFFLPPSARRRSASVVPRLRRRVMPMSFEAQRRTLIADQGMCDAPFH